MEQIESISQAISVEPAVAESIVDNVVKPENSRLGVFAIVLCGMEAAAKVFTGHPSDISINLASCAAALPSRRAARSVGRLLGGHHEE